jgi:hypothetical protein
MEAVQETHAICEAAICYTGDILDPKRDKYPLASTTSSWRRNWSAWARTSSPSRTWPASAGPTPRASWSRRCGGGRPADPLPHARHQRHRRRQRAAASEAGVDVVDLALASMSAAPASRTSIPSSPRCSTRRATPARSRRAQRILRLLGAVREYYAPFDTAPKHRQRRSLSARDARRPVHQPQGAGRQHGPGRTAGRRSRAPTPRSTSSSATSSRSRPQRRWSATWRCSSSARHQARRRRQPRTRLRGFQESNYALILDRVLVEP